MVPERSTPPLGMTLGLIPGGSAAPVPGEAPGDPATGDLPGYPDLVHFGVLGAVAAWTADGRQVEVRESKVRALLAVLLLSPGRVVPAGQLIDDLWGAGLPVHPAGALQGKVSRLRRALEAGEPGGGSLIAFRSPGYLLQVAGGMPGARRGASGGEHV